MEASSATLSAPAVVPMAGRFERAARFATCAFLFSAVGVTTANGETVRGESKELRIQFQVMGGAGWCGSRAKIRLTAASASRFQADTVPFLQMIGRIRAVVLVQCPSIEHIAFDGVAAGRVVFAAETSRLTKWRRFISLDPKTRRPACPPSVTEDACVAQVEAFLTAQSLMRGRAFDDTELTSVLQPDSNDLAFRSNGVIGKLRITSRSDLGNDFSTAGQFADAIIADISETCTKAGGTAAPVKSKDFGYDLVQREMSCRPPNAPVAQDVILVWASKEKFQVFSLWAEDSAGSGAISFAGYLADAIRRGN